MDEAYGGVLAAGLAGGFAVHFFVGGVGCEHCGWIVSGRLTKSVKALLSNFEVNGQER